MNAAEKLSREISRVTEVIGFYEETIQMAKDGKLPSLSPLTETVVLPMLRASLENAIKASGSNDVVQVVQALADLEGIDQLLAYKRPPRTPPPLKHGER